MDTLPPTAVAIGAAALGLVFGSFASALSYRLPRGESVMKGRSRCPHCGHELSARDLVPVLSWAAHRGACRHCKAKLSWRYPAIETLMAVLFVIGALQVANPLQVALFFAITLFAMTLAIIDLEHWRLPNSLMAVLAILLAIWSWTADRAIGPTVLLATIVLALSIGINLAAGKITGRTGFGMGDSKLLAAAALALPLGPWLLFAALAAVFGVFLGVLWWRRTGQTVFPFGPVVLASLWLALLWGESALTWMIALVR